MNEGTLTLTNSTLSGNTATNDGGGLANLSLTLFYPHGGAPSYARRWQPWPIARSMETRASMAAASATEEANLTLTNDTLTANLTTGGGNYSAALGTITNIGDILLTNTLIAGNYKGASPSTTPGDVAGTFDSKSAYNLIGDGDLLNGISNGSQGNQIGSASAGTVINAMLGPLANNGGPTETVALLTKSPAIDKGNNSLAIDPTTQQTLTWDQRGPGYARVNSIVDIGAFEYGAFLVTPTQLVPTPQPPTSVAVDTTFSLTVTAEDNSGNTAIAFDSPVTVSIASGPAGTTLGGTLTETAQMGVTTFTGLTLNELGKYTLNVTGGGLTGTIGPIQIVVGTAVQLVLTTEPPATVGTGDGFQVVVDAEDSFGFVNLSYTGDATVALISNPGGATLGGVLTVSFDAGIATFNGLTLNVADDGYLLQVTSSPLVAATTSNIDVTPVNLIVATQPPNSVTAGAGFGLVVNADTSGKLDSSFDGTVILSLVNPPGGATLGGTLSVTASNGVATFSGLTLDLAASGYTLRISSGGVSSATSNAFTITPATAAQMVITQPPPAAVTAGIGFGLEVAIEDPYGNLEIGDNSTKATASLQSGTGPLKGMTNVTVSGGVATFTNLADDRAETISLNFSSGNLTDAISNNIFVSPAAPSQFVIDTPPSSTATAGQAFGNQPVVYEEDQYGNLETGDNSTVVTATLKSGTGPLQGMTTVTVSGGIGTFTNLADNRAETISLKFSSGSLTNAISNNIVISPATASQLVVHTQPSSTATAGQAFGSQAVVYEEDPFGNLETGDNSTVVSATLESGTGPLKGTTYVTMSGGVATFTNLADNRAETISLNFGSGSLTNAISNNIVVSPAAASQLVIDAPPSSTATAGQAFGAQPVVYEEDPFGNLETGNNSTVVKATLKSGTGPLQGTTSVTVAGGIGTFANLADDRAETISLKFSSGSLTCAISNTIVDQSGGGVPIGDPHPAVTDGDSRAGIRVTACDL